MIEDEPDAIQIQMDIQSAVDEAVRNIREHALRQVMVMVNGLDHMADNEQDEDCAVAFQQGHYIACMQILVEIEAMIAKDVAT